MCERRAKIDLIMCAAVLPHLDFFKITLQTLEFVLFLFCFFVFFTEHKCDLELDDNAAAVGTLSHCGFEM